MPPSSDRRKSSDEPPQDDIDQLFSRLQPLAVPDDLMQQLLNRIQQLPLPQRQQDATSGTDETRGGEAPKKSH